MKEEPVDPRMEKLVASLYNELSPEEEREFQELLMKDPGLRAEWDDLVSTRSMLGAWEVEEKVPSFVMVDPEPARVRPAAGFLTGVRERFGSFFAVSGWAVAAAALLLMVFTLKGYRFERIDGGWAFRAPGKNTTAPVLNQDQLATSNPTPAPVEAPKTPEGGPVRETVTPQSQQSPVQLVSGGDYMTRQEFDRKSNEMVRVFAELMNDYRSRQDTEVANMVRTVYGQLNERQFADYRELRGRIEAVGLGLMAEQSRSETFDGSNRRSDLDSLSRESTTPDDTLRKSEGDKKDE